MSPKEHSKATKDYHLDVEELPVESNPGDSPRSSDGDQHLEETTVNDQDAESADDELDSAPNPLLISNVGQAIYKVCLAQS